MDTLLTPQQAAEEMGLSVRRIQQFCRQGRLGQKVGGRYLITRQGLDKFKASHDRTPGNPNWKKAHE